MNNETEITINSIPRVKALVETCSKYIEDIDVISGRHIVDAKSIMGILSLDLTKPLRIRIITGNETVIDLFMEDMEVFK